MDEKKISSSNNYLNIDDCGRLSRCSYRIIREEGSFNYHIVYVLSGKWEAVYNNETYSLSEGNFIFYYPNQPQNYAFYPENDGCEVLWLHFSGSAVREILNDLNFLPGVYRCRKSESIISSFSKLIHEDRLKSMYHNTAKNSLAIYLLLAMARNIALNRNVPWDTRTADLDINRVVTEMYQQYNNEYNPEHYAEICAMSVSGFSHKFKRILGVAPKKYFMNIKIDTSKELLSFTNLSIKEIANKVGFENSLYFSRLFKQETNLSPSEYRNKSKF